MPPSTLFSYISRRMLMSLASLTAGILILVMMIDLVETMRATGVELALAVQLTLLRTPALSLLMAPFVFLFASIWMFHQLNKRSEIAVMRSAGLSVWRLIGPTALIAALGGIIFVVVIDPHASRLYSLAEEIKSKDENGQQSFISVMSDGLWLRQNIQGARMIINASTLSADGQSLNDVTVWRLTDGDSLLERADAKRAAFSGNTLELHDTLLSSPSEPEPIATPIYAIRTALSADDLNDRVIAPETLSLWELPYFIARAETAALPTARYNMRFHDLCSMPLKLVAMVMIAAAFSMRPARMGGMLQLAALSIAAGFSFYMVSETAAAFGESGLAPAALAAWTPALSTFIIAVTALLFLEDG